MRKFAVILALVWAAALPRQARAQQAQSLSSVITDTVMNCLSPYGGGIQRGDKMMVLHFKAPTAALNEWAIGKFTEAFARQGAAAIGLNSRGAALSALSAQADTDFDAVEAASYGAQAGAKSVITGVFSPSGKNWALTVRAVRVSSKRTVWTKNYLIQPDAAFTALAAQPAQQTAAQPATQQTEAAPQQTAAQPPAAQPAAGTGTLTIRRDPVTGAITVTGTGGVTGTVVQPAQPAATEAATTASGQTPDGWPAGVDNARNLSYLSDVEKDVILELNKVRTNPSRYAELYIKPRIGDGKGSFRAAAQECYNNLLKLAARPMLIPEKGMCLAAKDHTKDQANAAGLSHYGTDKSDPFTRLSRYGTWGVTAGENIEYGSSTGSGIVINLLIDDGVPDRGHFKNNMNGDFKKVGVSVGSHRGYGTMCVIDFAGTYTSK